MRRMPGDSMPCVLLLGVALAGCDGPSRGKYTQPSAASGFLSISSRARTSSAGRPRAATTRQAAAPWSRPRCRTSRVSSSTARRTLHDAGPLCGGTRSTSLALTFTDRCEGRRTSPFAGSKRVAQRPSRPPSRMLSTPWSSWSSRGARIMNPTPSFRGMRHGRPGWIRTVDPDGSRRLLLLTLLVLFAGLLGEQREHGPHVRVPRERRQSWTRSGRRPAAEGCPPAQRRLSEMGTGIGAPSGLRQPEHHRSRSRRASIPRSHGHVDRRL